MNAQGQRQLWRRIPTGRSWPIARAKPLFYKAAAGQITKSILPPTALFRQRPLPDMICCSPAFCRMVAGIGHFGCFSLNFGLFGDFQSIIDFYTQVSDGAFQLGVPKQQLDRPQVRKRPANTLWTLRS